MAQQVRIVRLERDEDRAIILTYRGQGEKGQIEVPGGFAEFRQYVEEHAKDTLDQAALLAVGQALESSATFRELKESIEGKRFAVDVRAKNKPAVMESNE